MNFKNQYPPPSPPPSCCLEDKNSTSLDYFKIFKKRKSNDKCIALAQVDKKIIVCSTTVL